MPWFSSGMDIYLNSFYFISSFQRCVRVKCIEIIFFLKIKVYKTPSFHLCYKIPLWYLYILLLISPFQYTCNLLTHHYGNKGLEIPRTPPYIIIGTSSAMDTGFTPPPPIPYVSVFPNIGFPLHFIPISIEAYQYI